MRSRTEPGAGGTRGRLHALMSEYSSRVAPVHGSDARPRGAVGDAKRTGARATPSASALDASRVSNAAGAECRSASGGARRQRPAHAAPLREDKSRGGPAPSAVARARPAQPAPSSIGSSAVSAPRRGGQSLHLSTCLEALEASMRGVWHALGLLDLSASELSVFVAVLRRHYKRVFAPAAGANNASRTDESHDESHDEEADADNDALLVRCVLWRTLSNAVFYCIAALDPRRLRASSASRAELEKRTGGVEDAYEVVYGSSSDDDEANAKGRAQLHAAPFVPVPLRWRDGTGAAEAAGGGEEEEERDDEATVLERLRARVGALPIVDWYLTLRCLAQLQYRRDAVYMQSPSQGCPHELLLALLWLTKKYALVAVAEYTATDQQFAFLLRYYSDGPGPTRQASALQRAIGQASVWPPDAFDEPRAAAARLSQVERIVGGTKAVGVKERASVAVRRLLALRRLVELSLNRVQHALHLRSEQYSALGLHSAADVQLCQRSNDAAYAEVLAGLRHVAGMRARVQERLDRLSVCGQLVAHALRKEPPLIREMEVAAGLREDDATWLADSPSLSELQRQQRGRAAGEAGEQPTTPPADDDKNSGGCNSAAAAAEQLDAVVSRFRAARTRQYLLDAWKTAVRREQSAPPPPAGEDGAAHRRQPFTLDKDAQYREECRVHNGVISRYSLQSALSAEAAVLRFQHRQQQQQQQQRAVDGATAKSADAAPLSLPSALTLALAPMALITSARSGAAPTSAARWPWYPNGSTRAVQLTEVGAPAPGATTSALLEVERLSAVREGLEGTGAARQRQEQRVARCQAALQHLYSVHGLRLATSCLSPEERARAAAHKQTRGA